MKFTSDYQYVTISGDWDTRKAAREKLEFGAISQIEFEKHCRMLKFQADLLRHLGMPEEEVRRRMSVKLWYS